MATAHVATSWTAELALALGRIFQSVPLGNTITQTRLWTHAPSTALPRGTQSSPVGRKEMS